MIKKGSIAGHVPAQDLVRVLRPVVVEVLQARAHAAGRVVQSLAVDQLRDRAVEVAAGRVNHEVGRVNHEVGHVSFDNCSTLKNILAILIIIITN